MGVADTGEESRARLDSTLEGHRTHSNATGVTCSALHGHHSTYSNIHITNITCITCSARNATLFMVAGMLTVLSFHHRKWRRPMPDLMRRPSRKTRR